MSNDCNKSKSPMFTFFALAAFVGTFFLIKKLKHREPHEEEQSKVVDKTYSKIEVKKEPEKILGLNGRQNEILTSIRRKGTISPKELQKLLPNVSTRTIRRDMDSLVLSKLVSQEGSTKSTFYKYIGK